MIAHLRRRREPPAHLDQLALAIMISDDRRNLVRENRWQGRDVACAIAGYIEGLPHRGLCCVRAIEIAHGWNPPSWHPGVRFIQEHLSAPNVTISAAPRNPS